MEGREIRRRFIDFFVERGHVLVPSSSLIPDDPSLLLTTAGMVQFKPYFLGEQEPPYPRATSVQKSFRTTDIDLVGHTARHLTFFEMLGNFSFGDYFKEGAIDLAWELVTEGYGIEADRLWATVYESDDEAEELWKRYLPAERIVRRGMDDNFWSMGVAGPCGPSSEIFVDRGPRFGPDGGPAVDEERFMEIWNLVFMQYERDDDFTIVGELERKGIDTGSGLERVAIVLQDVPSAFETDLLAPILDAAQELTGRTYGEDERADVSLRILAEHGRATTFVLADGVVPSNEGRGYVVRRMLRKLVTHARRLGVTGQVFPVLAERTIETLGDVWHELRQNRATILQQGAGEEERFSGTLRQGLTVLEHEVERLGGKKVLPGETAFRLHDTYGFPLELTLELAEEQGLQVDTDAFARLMEEQRVRARGSVDRARREGDEVLAEVSAALGRSLFLAYETLQAEATVGAIVRGNQLVDGAAHGDEVLVVLDRTPFYPEGGGQVGDAGTIRSAGGVVRVEDTRYGPGQVIVHRGRVAEGEIRTGETAFAAVDAERREATARSHTATHVLHWTIRDQLGEHARQAGSLVEPGRLRFDFAHFEAPGPDVVEHAEEVANRRLAEDAAVRPYETTLEYARSIGAIALFGEKYGDIVRVVEIGDYSVELCGGTHVPHTGKVAVLRVLREGSIGSGLRRIEALVGPDALHHMNLERRLLEEITREVGAGDPSQAPGRVRQAMARIKELESELGKIRAAARREEAKAALADAMQVDGVSLVVHRLENVGADELRQHALSVVRQLEANGKGAVVLGTANADRALMVAAVTPELAREGVTAPKLLEEAARRVGGNAGGKDRLSFGGGGKPQGLADALGSIHERLAALLTG